MNTKKPSFGLSMGVLVALIALMVVGFGIMRITLQSLLFLVIVVISLISVAAGYKWSEIQGAMVTGLMRGVIPMTIPQEDNEEMLFEAAVMAAKQAGIAVKGDKVVLTAGVPLSETGNTNMIRVFEVF